MMYRSKKKLSGKIVKGLIAILTALGISQMVFGLPRVAHWRIGEVAMTLWENYATDHPETTVGKNVISWHWDLPGNDNDIKEGIWEEDDNVPNIGQHFWNPDGGDNDGLCAWSSAYNRASNYWDNYVLPNYRDGDYGDAYYYFGCIVHLLGDMSTPAHVNLDDHLPDFPDSYEEYMKTNYTSYSTTGITMHNSIRAFMIGLAEEADEYDSDDSGTWNICDEWIAVGETDNGSRCADGFTPAEHNEIANDVFTSAMRYTAGLYKYFIETVKPTCQVIHPNGGEWKMGNFTIKARAHSYGKAFSDADYVNHVTFAYSTVDNPSANDWITIGTDNSFDADYYYTISFPDNTINDSVVWVRALSWDDGELESFWDTCDESFGIDNTNPTVEILSFGPDGQSTRTGQWSGDDALSGLDPDTPYCYRLNRGAYSEWTWTTSTSKTFTGLDSGVYILYVKSKDKAGNESATDDDTSLPVELSSFSATSEGGAVTLFWRTETEVGNIGFSIYRSEEKDGNYVKIAFVNGAGNTAMPTDYQFIDKKAEAGKTYFYYLEDVDIAGEKNRNKIIKVVVPPAKPAQPIPKEFRLLQNYPNPFNPETWIPYDLATDATVTIHIHNVKGQLVRQFDLAHQKAGSYLDKERAAYWDGKNQTGEAVSSGIYFYTLKAGDFHATRRMVIVR